jgi:hypothetical protein
MIGGLQTECNPVGVGWISAQLPGWRLRLTLRCRVESRWDSLRQGVEPAELTLVCSRRPTLVSSGAFGVSSETSPPSHSPFTIHRGPSYNPLMRRRWKALVVAGAVAIFALPFTPIAAKGDGLDWIRRYGPTESVDEFETSDCGFSAGWPKSRVYTHSFRFRTIPTEVEAYVSSSPAEFLSPLLDKKSGLLVVTVIDEPTWLEEKWFEMKRRMSLR